MRNTMWLIKNLASEEVRKPRFNGRCGLAEMEIAYGKGSSQKY